MKERQGAEHIGVIPLNSPPVDLRRKPFGQAHNVGQPDQPERLANNSQMLAEMPQHLFVRQSIRGQLTQGKCHQRGAN